MRSSKKYTLGFIGFGHMGSAIGRGAATSEYLERHEIAVYDLNAERTKPICREESFDFLSSEKEIAQNCHIVLLAVQPQKMDETLKQLKGENIECLLSIVTGVSIAHIQEILGNVPVIRAMPNTPLRLMEGATALCMSKNCAADDYDFVYKLFSDMGVTRTVQEENMADTVTVNGSTPAYFYYIVDCLVKDAVERGFDEEVARSLIVQTMIGSGKMLQQDKNKPIDVFVDEVATKGGTTIEAINTLREENILEVLHDANEKCAKRARELGK